MLYAVVLAGGRGTRLWPLSRTGHPKFLHALTGSSASLLQATVNRLAPLAPMAQTYVVTGAAHAAAVARQLPRLPEDNLLVEPASRDSCPAIGLAAAVIAQHEPRAVMASFAADQLIGDADRFVEVLRQAEVGAREGLLMTVGITPTSPETGYGYLQCGPARGDGPIRVVERFKEKPTREVAVEYLESGRYLWNAGMFVWRVDVFLAELARQRPEMHAGLIEIARAWSTSDRGEVLGEIWPSLPKVSVDYAVMEGAGVTGLVATVPGDFGWNDVGDFDTLGALLPHDDRDNVVIGGGEKPVVLLRDTSRTVVVPDSGRLVATLGVGDLVIVDTPDALLVCARDQAQRVKQVVDELADLGEQDYL